MLNPQRDVRGYLASFGGGIRVEMFESDGEWVVRVIEDDEERTYSFVLKTFALAFAEGQRSRVRPPAIMQLERNPPRLFGYTRVRAANDRY
ncbi:hypothetical protein OHD62_15690 [Mesorhizobium sp. YC-39]|uniref:hypothetical protein n=1 Tax=unclassified Mesorhizobium TaxID=325217 RepID=UPI0021E7EC08|nr:MULTISPECIES: hypothetical protein [unclassified Mesorhizobium]MCV3208084.1 hypothetical protein [Mesorhizobium sp. YC-2]MCV3229811.1 hypothetical protein [Mesorhizobium sp. YC-39]